MGEGFDEISEQVNTKLTEYDKLKEAFIIAVVLGLMILGISMYENYHQRNVIAIQTNNLEAITAKMKLTVSNDSLKDYQIQAIDGLNTKTLLQLKTKDSSIEELQKVVKNYKGKLQSATVFSSNTNVNTNTATTVVTINGEPIHDSVCDYKNIEFTSNIHLGKWINGNVVARFDSIKTNLVISNEYSVIVGFNKKVPYGDVTTKNPYDTIKTLRTFDIVLPKPKHWTIGIYGGYGISSDGSLIYRGFQIGVGISREIIRLPF